MRALAIKLKPEGAFHFGERGVGIEETAALAHSDTIFSGLCWAWTLLFGEDELETLLERFIKGQPPFLISSAFPYAGRVLFLPRPLTFRGKDDEETRRLKRVEYVSFEVYKLLLAGSIPDDYVLIQKGRLCLTESEFKGLPSSTLDEDELRGFLRVWASMEKSQKPESTSYAHCYRLWEMEEVPHVTVDRVTAASNIFQEGGVRFAKECGIYILVRFFDEKMQGRFLAAMHLLGDEGLGGRRSTGRGFFKVENIEKIEIPEVANGEYVILFSLLNPRENEILTLLDLNSAYKLVARRGWVYSAKAKNLRRKRVIMFAEGAVLKQCNKEMIGRMVKVLSRKDSIIPHDVYRYGYGFTVRWKLEGRT